MMNTYLKTVISVVVIILAILLIIRACESIKSVNLKSKNTDQKTSYTLDVEKTK